MPYTEALVNLYAALEAASIRVRTNEPMSEHTTFRIGGNASLVAWPTSRDQLVESIRLWKRWGEGCPFCVLGRGSNVLFEDRGYHGLIIITNRVNAITYSPCMREDGKQVDKSLVCVHADCGVPLIALAYRCARQEPALSGLEFACGIPGSVGGAVLMNAGAYWGEMSVPVENVTYYDMDTDQICIMPKEGLCYSYRHSIFCNHPEWIILSATLVLSIARTENVLSLMNRNREIRKNSQPIEFPSAGSVFKRAEGTAVWKVIDKAGLRGYSIGGAQVSEKHTGFIVNRGGASAEDVKALVSLIQERVFSDSNGHTLLTREICYIEDGLDERLTI